MNLFDLIIILLFIVAPVLSAIFRRRQSPPQAQRPGDPAPAESASAPSEASASRNQASSQAGTSQSTSRAGGGFDQRLEQARQRVREAMGEAAPSASLDDAREAQRRMAAEAARSQNEAARLQQQSRQRLGIENPSKVKKPPSQPVARARPDGAKTAKLRRGLLSLEPEALQHGILWHEILSEPLAKRKSWRRPFRLR